MLLRVESLLRLKTQRRPAAGQQKKCKGNTHAKSSKPNAPRNRNKSNPPPKKKKKKKKYIYIYIYMYQVLC